MCGIVGLIDLKQGLRDTDRNAISRAAGLLAHRGPDKTCIWGDSQSSFAHCKLSILDFSDRSNQPLVKDGVVLLLNGEIYNYRELYEEQDIANHFADGEFVFDASVVQNGYLARGIEILRPLRGDFAIAIYDSRSKTLYLARDRLGVKQLVYRHSGSRLYFASEAKAFKAFEEITLTPNLEVIAEDWLMGFWGDKTRTYFEGIYHVPPAHYLKLTANDLSTTRYWNLPSSAHHVDADTAAGSIRELLASAVESQLMGEAKVAALLSGGLDSSLLCAWIAKMRPHQDLQCYSVLYDGVEDNCDFRHAQCVAQDHPNIKLHAVEISPQEIDLERLDLLTYHMEEVVWDRVYNSIYRNYLAMREHGLRIAINGQGSDELWLGYYYTFPHYKLRGDQLRSDFLRTSFATKLLQHAQALRPEFLCAKKAADILQSNAEKNLWPYLEGDDLNSIAKWATNTHLQSILMQEDRLAMACSVECRVPHIDHRVAELAFSLPGELKVLNGKEKYLLRRAAQGSLPEVVLERSKFHFPDPSSRYQVQIEKFMQTESKKCLECPLVSSIINSQLRKSIQSGEAIGSYDLLWRLVAIHRFGKVFQ